MVCLPTSGFFDTSESGHGVNSLSQSRMSKVTTQSFGHD